MHSIIVVLILVATAASGLDVCPKVQEVDWDIELLLPHWKCNKFIQCTHGEPVEMSCPEGLYFNIIKEICDWGDNVDCGLRVIPDKTKPDDGVNDNPATEDESSNIPEEIIQTEKPDIPVIEFLPNGCPVDPRVHWLLPHETICNMFYYCVQGERDISTCPYRLHFNKELQICDWPRNVKCVVDISE